MGRAPESNQVLTLSVGSSLQGMRRWRRVHLHLRCQEIPQGQTLGASFHMPARTKWCRQVRSKQTGGERLCRRHGRCRKTFAHRKDLANIQHPLIRFEERLNGLSMNLHFQRSDAQRPIKRLTAA